MDTISLSVIWAIDKESTTYVKIIRILFSHEREVTLAICDNMKGLWRHYTEYENFNRNKILYDITYTWTLQKLNLYK